MWTQRRVSTSTKTLRLPRVLLALVFADLIWEIVKANLSEQNRGTWPWRFTLLDTSICAAIVTLLTGIIVTRTQLSQTLQPVLSWSGSHGGSRTITDSQRTVILVNAGGGRSVVRSVSHRVQTSPQYTGRAEIPSGWMPWHTAVSSIKALGLDWDQDFFLLHLGSGAAIPMTASSREGLELLALNPKAFELLSILDIRIQVTDSLGDVYERDLQCIRPRPTSPS